MKIPTYQVDAFTGAGFLGNPAAVCLLDAWLPDEILQALAARFGLSETAYLVQDHDGNELRWFTPTIEVDLCGHATLATAYVMLTHVEPKATSITFKSRSGTLNVAKEEDLLVLDFPTRMPVPEASYADVVDAVGLAPKEVLATPRDCLLVYESEDDVRVLEPDMTLLAVCDRPCAIATAPGKDHDFVSRFFGPGVGVDEDPATGSAHCVLTPYWSKRLGKTKLHAAQVSKQGGELFCEHLGERVSIGGRVEPFIEGIVHL